MEVNILGSGLMGRQIASLFIIGGFNVHIWDIINNFDPTLLKININLLEKKYKTGKRGKYTYTNSIEQVDDCLTIECVCEDLKIKKKLYNSLKSKISKGYFSNTSSFSPNEIGAAVGGLHFFNPITLGIVEYYSLPQRYSVESQAIFDFFSELNFDIIHVKANRGYAGNFLLFHEISTAFKLIEKFNYTVDMVKGIYRKIYMRRDIFKIVDIIGLDVVSCIFRNLHEVDNSLYIPKTIDIALERNILGKKNKTSILDLLK